MRHYRSHISGKVDVLVYCYRSSCTSPEEVELIHRKCDVDLELFTLNLQAILVGNDEIIGLGVAVFQRLQIEAAPEGTILPVVTGLVRNDLLDITDCFSGTIREVQLVGCRLPVAANSLLLIEVQGEAHIADLPVGRQQTDFHRLGVVLALILLILDTLITQETIIYSFSIAFDRSSILSTRGDLSDWGTFG